MSFSVGPDGRLGMSVRPGMSAVLLSAAFTPRLPAGSLVLALWEPPVACSLLLWDPRVRGRRDGWRRLRPGLGGRHVPVGRGSSLLGLLSRVGPVLGLPPGGARLLASAVGALGPVPEVVLLLDVMGS